MFVCKSFSVQKHEARTLCASVVRDMSKEFKRPKELLYLEQDLKEDVKTDDRSSSSSRLHDGVNESGWEIRGRLFVDTFLWVNEFAGQHAQFGVVFGDFEKQVSATSQAGYDHFVKHHPYVEWSYHDI